jgi:hypothetical protein
MRNWVRRYEIGWTSPWERQIEGLQKHGYEMSGLRAVAYPGIFFGRGSTNSVEDRERWSGGGSPIVRGSGGSCNLVQEISFHISKLFLIFWYFRLFMMTTNLFVITNVKQLRTEGVLEFHCLFFRTSWGVGVLNSAIFKLIRMVE